MQLQSKRDFVNMSIFSCLVRFSFILNCTLFAKTFSGSSLALLISDYFIHFDLPMISTNLDKGHAFFMPSKSLFLVLFVSRTFDSNNG